MRRTSSVNSLSYYLILDLPSWTFLGIFQVNCLLNSLKLFFLGTLMVKVVICSPRNRQLQFWGGSLIADVIRKRNVRRNFKDNDKKRYIVRNFISTARPRSYRLIRTELKTTFSNWISDEKKRREKELIPAFPKQ